MDMSMTSTRRQFIASTAAVAATGGPTTLTQAAARKLLSISAMVLAPDGRLIVADWRAGELHSLALPTMAAASEQAFNVSDLSDRLAAAYRLPGGMVRVTAAAFHSVGQTAILALAMGRRTDAPVGLALLNARGEVQRLDAQALVRASTPLQAAPPEARLWGNRPARSLLVTDIKIFGNELLVAGLGNGGFNSTLRRVPYPFDGTARVAAIEMYHAVHNQIETRAPVRAFSVIDVEGTPTLLAAYTCTPLVTVPMADLTEGARVRGKTIAELGFGNTPLDVVPFAIDYRGRRSEWVLVANSAKAADLIALPDIVAAAKGPGLSKPVQAPFDALAGVRSIALPMANVQKVMEQSPQFLVALRRGVEDGQLQLVSVRKGAFFRLSDFVNEYDFPDYAYPADDKFQQEYIRPFHRMMKTDEGHASLIK
jgi:hypothetical protein